MDDEWEEEEQLVVVELSGIINSDFLTKCQGTCKILDIASEQPVMQVGRFVFAGEYKDAMGTCVLFEEGQTSAATADSEATQELKYKCHTVKRLMMQRTFLTEKKEGEPSTGPIEIQSLKDKVLGRKDSRSYPSQDPQERTRQEESGEKGSGYGSVGDGAEG